VNARRAAAAGAAESQPREKETTIPAESGILPGKEEDLQRWKIR